MSYARSFPPPYRRSRYTRVHQFGSCHHNQSCAAAVWKDGHFTELGTGQPIAINSRGDIIGVWYSRYGYQAILWRKKSGT